MWPRRAVIVPMHKRSILSHWHRATCDIPDVRYHKRWPMPQPGELRHGSSFSAAAIYLTQICVCAARGWGSGKVGPVPQLYSDFHSSKPAHSWTTCKSDSLTWRGREERPTKRVCAPATCGALIVWIEFRFPAFFHRGSPILLGAYTLVAESSLAKSLDFDRKEMDLEMIHRKIIWYLTSWIWILAT